MFKVKFCLVFAACSLLFATDAMADGFSLTATSPTTNISATLTGTPTGTPGVYDMTGMSGTVDGYSVTLLATSWPGTVTTSSVVNGWEILYDDLLNLNSPYFDLYGLAFTADGTLGNLYYSNKYLYAQLGDNPVVPETISVSVIQTPEPSSLLLLLGSFLIVGGMVLRRMQTV